MVFLLLLSIIFLSTYKIKPVLPLSPGACLRVAASAKAGERAGVRGVRYVHPSPSQRLSEPAATHTLPHQGGGEIGQFSSFVSDDFIMNN